MAPGIPPAYMGFVGFVRFIGGELDGQIVRVTSADLSLKQEITRPDVIDSRYDRSVYQLGPRVIEGTLAFPALYGFPDGGGNMLLETYKLAAYRDATSGVLLKSTFDVKYAQNDNPNHSEFRYTDNVMNTWQMSVAAEESVNRTLGVIGTDRIQRAHLVETGLLSDDMDPPTLAQMPVTRVVTWNDAVFQIYRNPAHTNHTTGRLSVPPAPNALIDRDYIRSFEVNINNNVQRFYTLNGLLVPQDIAPTKRDVNGNAVLMGRHESLGDLAFTNDQFCNEVTEIRFGYDSSIPETEETCQGKFIVRLPNVVFEIEEIALTNDLFESTVAWHSLVNAASGTLGNLDPLISGIE